MFVQFAPNICFISIARARMPTQRRWLSKWRALQGKSDWTPCFLHHDSPYFCSISARRDVALGKINPIPMLLFNSFVSFCRAARKNTNTKHMHTNRK